VYLAVCLSVGTLTVAFLGRFSPADEITPKKKNEFVRGSISHHPFSFPPNKIPILGQEVLKTHGNVK